MGTRGFSAVARTTDASSLGRAPNSCATPPYCHRWWLNNDSGLNLFVTLFLGAFVAILAAVVLGILCAGIVLVFRSCLACCGDPNNSARKAGYSPVDGQDLLDLHEEDAALKGH